MANWVKRVTAGMHKGALHTDLNIPQGQKIPESRLEEAAEQGGKVGKRANFAMTLKGFNHKSPFGKVKVGGK